MVVKDEWKHEFDIDALRDTWYRTSALLDEHQSMNGMAAKRYANYKNQPLQIKLHDTFKGSFESLGINPDRWKDAKKNGKQAGKAPVAAIIREKGTNGDREMAYSLWLAGFEVKDVMTVSYTHLTLPTILLV